MLCLLAVIAGGGYDDYKGFWKQEGKIKPTVFETKQDGDTYLMVDVFSAENKSIVLSPKDGKLYVDGQKEVGLSEDKKTMYGGGQTFVKLDDNTFKYKECMEVVNGYRQASQGLSTWKDGDKLNELREQYKPQFEALPNCRHPF